MEHSGADRSAMKRNNLFTFLSKLDEDEFKRFGKFIDSPYFNSNKKLKELYDLLEKHYPEFSSADLDKKIIHDKLYKGTKFVGGTYYYLISEMEALLEKFIGIEKAKPFTFDLTYLEELTRLGMHNKFDTRYKSIKKKLAGSPDEMHFDHLLLSELKRNDSIVKREFLTKKDVIRPEWLEPAQELVNLFLKNSLRNILFLSNYNNLVLKETGIPLLNETLEYIERNRIHETSQEIRVLYFEIRLVLNKESKYYSELKSIAVNKRRYLSRDSFRELISILSNHNVQTNVTNVKSSSDYEHYNRENKELAKIYLKDVERNKNEVLPIDAYFSFFLTGIATDDIDWLNELQRKFVKRLETKFQNNASCYSKGAVYYLTGEFEKSLIALSGIKNYSYLPFKAVVKVLQLKVFYELEMFSEAEDAANSYKQFLRNDSIISRQAKIVNSDFLRIYIKLLHITGNGTLKKVNDLQSEIKNMDRFLNSVLWFTGKLEMLEKKFR